MKVGRKLVDITSEDAMQVEVMIDLGDTISCLRVSWENLMDRVYKNGKGKLFQR